ncbi:helix-turn-helix domain-containing protein [Aurantimonas sp. HBX-1]|uniref:helix-turn-helix domain-containing protein n=1 Tax=Aurantimonas sp. HBX-1 TaxID=2906072 RepID=UPI00351D3001
MPPFPGSNPGAPASTCQRKTIERLFISETGMPPAQWLRFACLPHAISQLTSRKKIGTVAFDLGYDFPSSSSSMFRKTLGSSPSSFLQRTIGRPRPGT